MVNNSIMYYDLISRHVGFFGKEAKFELDFLFRTIAPELIFNT